MKTILLLTASMMIVFGLMILQLRSLKRYHPNAELLISVLKRLNSDSSN